MAHELEIIDGTASYVGRFPGWHQLGHVVSQGLTYERSLEYARLAGWNVRDEPLVARVGPNLVQVDGHNIILRSNPVTKDTEALAVVGDRYTPIQNEQAFAVVPHLESLGAKVETAGSIRGGRQVFMSMTLPSSFVLDPEGAADAVNMYLLLLTSHDGTLATEAGGTGVRVVCANTLDWAIQKLTRSYRIRHTARGPERLAQAQAALLMANKYGKGLAAEAVALYQTPMDAKGFTEVATTLYPKPDGKKAAVTRWENKIDLLGDLFGGGGDTTYTLGNVRNTAWAGLNALTERLDWHRKARGGDGTSLAIARMGLNPAITVERNKAHSIVVEWAKERNAKAFEKVPVSA
jgi:phage/plasmid-like protein (TIGR03299 family)